MFQDHFNYQDAEMEKVWQIVRSDVNSSLRSYSNYKNSN